MMEIFINGTGGTALTKDRFLCSCAVRYNGRVFLLDCGEGTQVAYNESGWGFKNIDVIFLSHAHNDHVAGLPGVLTKIKYSDRTEPITVIGPRNTVNSVIAAKDLAFGKLPFDINFVPVEDLINDNQTVINNLSLKFLKLAHCPQSYGVKIETRRKPKFCPEKAIKLGIPQKDWKYLHKGASFVYNEKVYTQNDVTEDSKKNISFCYIPDTNNTVLKEIREFINKTDLTICECTYATNKEKKDKNHLCLDDIEKGKLSYQTDGTGTRKLGLIHFSLIKQKYNINNLFNTFLAKDGQLIVLNYEN